MLKRATLVLVSFLYRVSGFTCPTDFFPRGVLLLSTPRFLLTPRLHLPDRNPRTSYLKNNDVSDTRDTIDSEAIDRLPHLRAPSG